MFEQFEMMLTWLPALIIGLTVHEAAHAYSAKLLGDPTAERLGRISLNPLRHLTLMGTAALFLISIGWGKPVPVNINNFTKPKFHYLLTSLAGPASNLILAAISLGVLYLNPPYQVARLLHSLFMINSILAVFNLLPIPPLDGSKIWPCIIPGMSLSAVGKIERFGVIIFIIAIATGAVGKVMGPAIDVLYKMSPNSGYAAFMERPEGFPEAIVMPEGASGAMYMSFPEESPTMYSLFCSFDEAYPANGLRLSIKEQFGAPEWVKLKYDLDDPNGLCTDDWKVVDDKEMSELYDNWSYAWVNEKDEVVQVKIYHLRNEVLNSQVVYNLFTDSKVFEEYQLAHPEEFEVVVDVDQVDGGLDLDVEKT